MNSKLCTFVTETNSLYCLDAKTGLGLFPPIRNFGNEQMRLNISNLVLTDYFVLICTVFGEITLYDFNTMKCLIHKAQIPDIDQYIMTTNSNSMTNMTTDDIHDEHTTTSTTTTLNSNDHLIRLQTIDMMSNEEEEEEEETYNNESDMYNNNNMKVEYRVMLSRRGVPLLSIINHSNKDHLVAKGYMYHQDMKSWCVISDPIRFFFSQYSHTITTRTKLPLEKIDSCVMESSDRLRPRGLRGEIAKSLFLSGKYYTIYYMLFYILLHIIKTNILNKYIYLGGSNTMQHSMGNDSNNVDLNTTSSKTHLEHRMISSLFLQSEHEFFVHLKAYAEMLAKDGDEVGLNRLIDRFFFSLYTTHAYKTPHHDTYNTRLLGEMTDEEAHIWLKSSVRRNLNNKNTLGKPNIMICKDIILRAVAKNRQLQRFMAEIKTRLDSFNNKDNMMMIDETLTVNQLDPRILTTSSTLSSSSSSFMNPHRNNLLEKRLTQK